jgi:amidohydrolase
MAESAPALSAIFGLHGWPSLPLGKASTRPGPLMAATDSFAATFIGQGCHGAFPHLGIDPIPAACEAVLNVQQCVSRELSPTEPGLVSVCMIHSGTAVNIIPDSATIQGTIRSLNNETRLALREAVQRRCAGVAAAQRCKLEFQLNAGYPATINSTEMSETVRRAVIEALGPDGFVTAERPVMGGEDFAYYLEKVPGCFFFLGVCPPGRDSYFALHTSQYDFPDAAIEPGIRIFASIVSNYSSDLNK